MQYNVNVDLYGALRTTVTRHCDPQQNMCVFSNWRKSKRLSSESHRWRARLFLGLWEFVEPHT